MSVRLNAIALWALFALLLLSVPWPKAHAQTIKQNSAFVITALDSATLLCAKSSAGNKSVAVKKIKLWVYEKGKKKKKSHLVSINPDINKLKAQIYYLAKSKKNANKVKKLKVSLNKMLVHVSGCTKGPPKAEALFVQLSENGAAQIILKGKSPRKGTLTYAIGEWPSKGNLSAAAADVQYTTKLHALGTDSFSYVVKDKYFVSAPAKVSISILPSSLDFAGLPQSLQAYRATLSEREVVHFLRKAALGGNAELVNVGVTQGLDALIDALFALPAPPDLEARALQNAGVGNGFLWGTTNAQFYWVTHMLEGNPLRELIAYLLHDHLATNTTRFDRSQTSSTAIVDHVQLLRQHAFGNFENLMVALSSDVAMSNWLDNRLNEVGNLNENYGREILELFMLGARRQITGEPNYTYRSVQAATRSLTGYFSFLDNGIERIGFSPQLFDSGTKTLFAATPWEASSSFDAPAFIHHVLWQHPEAARYIAGKFFSTIVHPQPNEAVLDQLAALLKESNFELQPFLRTLLKSSAMFSPQSRKVCVDSPAQTLISFMRRAGLPAKNQATVSVLVANMQQANNAPLMPADVFGFKGCGVNRDTIENYGEVWIASQGLLNVSNAFNEILNIIQIKELGFDFLSLLPSPTAQPSEIVDVFRRRLGLEVSPEALADMRDYLSTNATLQAGNLVLANVDWANESPAFKRKKLAGLLAMMAVLPSFRAR